jgi:hypothetical protein
VTRPKWKRFEDLVETIQRELADPAARVQRNEPIPGRKSKTSRDIDVSIRVNVGGYELLIAVSCKDHKRPVTLKEVGEFVDVVADVGANKAAMVASNGFSASARRRAAEAGVDLLRAVDTGHHEWRSYVTIPAIARQHHVASFSLGIHPKVPGSGWIDVKTKNWRDVPILRADGSVLGTVLELCCRRWRQLADPKPPEVPQDFTLADEDTFVDSRGGRTAVVLRGRVIVETNFRFGQLPVDNFKGFRDEISGLVRWKAAKVRFPGHDTVEQEWKLLTSEEVLAVKPMVYIDYRTAPERWVTLMKTPKT